MRIRLEQFVSREAPSDNFKPNQTLQTTNFMCFDAFKSGVVSKRLLNETTWNKQRRRKRTDNTKKRFWKTNLTVQTFNKVTETTWNLQHQRKRHFSE
ncbi:hypothetical protein AKG79_21945 [Vibrio parahaemolyticus]|nr:hypothetical protein AKG79_21945 [Vibrio parahaemolyticus]